MSRTRAIAKYAFTALVLGCVAYFFYEALKRNWSSIRAHDFELSWPLVLAGVATAAGAILLYDYAWYVSVRRLSGRDVTFTQTCAVVNASSLTKYIPGKIWSFAYQVYFLNRIGLAKSLTVYVNLVNTLISIVVSVLLGVALLLSSSAAYATTATWGILALLLIGDAAFLLFHTPLLNFGIRLLNRLLKRTIPQLDVPLGLMLQLHGIHFVAAIVSALGGYAMCFALGYQVDSIQVISLMGAMLLSEVVGFFAFMVPGGLGVRESAMYVLMGGAAVGSLAVVLPIATRLVAMIAEMLLGLVALRLMSSFAKQPD